MPSHALAALPGARSATDGTSHDVFLGGDYIELGINSSGSFGSASNKPGNFYGTSVRNQIGMSTDFDGFNTGTDYRMDYFMPGSPFEGWSAGYKISGSATKGLNAQRTGTEDITGVTVTDTSSGNTLSANIVGTLGSKLKITQTVTFSSGDRFFKNTIKLENVSAGNLDSVRYMRIFDPDNTKDRGGLFPTVNSVLYQYDTDGKAAVQADTSNNNSDPLYTALGTRSPILFYSSDSHARVGYGTSTDIYNSSVYDIVPAKGSTHDADEFIFITYDVGTLTPGQSQTVTYYMSLDNRDFSEVLNDIQQDEAPDPTPVASSSAIPLTQWTDTKGGSYKFEGVLLENLYTEETLPTFVFTEAKDSTVGLAKYQLILWGPNYPSKVYFDEIAPSSITQKVETSERLTEYLTDIHRISVRSKRDGDRLPPGEYKWKVRAFNTQGVTVDSSEKVLRIGSYHAVFTNTVFPVTLLQAGNLTNLDISSIHPDKSIAPLNLGTATPIFYGIANVNAQMKLILKNSIGLQIAEYKTTANAESRFGINVTTPLAPGMYTVNLSATNDRGDFVELASLAIRI